MSLRNRILLDRLLATPVAHLLDTAALVLGKVLGRSHDTGPHSTRRIVVCKLVGFGSAIQATAFLETLRARYPDARITFLTLHGNRDVVARLPEVNAVETLDDSTALRMLASTIRAVWRMNREQVDHYFDLELYSRFSSALAVLSRARNRGGFFRYTARFRRGIYTHLVYFNTRLPVSEVYLQLARAFGCEPVDRGARVRAPDEGDFAALAREVPEVAALPRGGFVVVNPNASDLLLERRWPAARFGWLIQQLLSRDIPVIVIGSAHERTHTRLVVEAAGADPRLHDVAGRTSIPGLVALLSRARVVITNDSGPMHLAFALGVPTVALFGPATPGHYGVSRPNVALHYAAVPCSPCVHEVDTPPCGGDNVCMQLIAAEEVLASALALHATGTVPTRATGSTHWDDPRTHLPIAVLRRAPA